MSGFFSSVAAPDTLALKAIAPRRNEGIELKCIVAVSLSEKIDIDGAPGGADADGTKHCVEQYVKH